MQRTREDRNWPYRPALALFPIIAVIARIAIGPDPKGSWNVPVWCGAAAALMGLALTATLSGVVAAWQAHGLSSHAARLAVALFISGAGLQLLLSLPAPSDLPQWLGLPLLAGAGVIAIATATLRIARRRRDPGALNSV